MVNLSVTSELEADCINLYIRTVQGAVNSPSEAAELVIKLLGWVRHQCS